MRERCEKVVLQLAGLPKKKTHFAYLPNLAEIEGEIELFKKMMEKYCKSVCKSTERLCFFAANEERLVSNQS